MMVRTLLLTVAASSIAGTLLGLAFAYYALSVDAWQLETEMQSYERIVETASLQRMNPNAKASIEETTHFFGVMDVKSTGTHDFFIKNVGTEDLILEVDRLSCTCTGIEITPGRVVPPGRTAICQLKYNAEQALPGRFSQGGTIRTNDPENREITLLVEGVFTSPVVVNPSPVGFGRVPAGVSRKASIRFYGFEHEPLQLSAPSWESREHFDFHWEPAIDNDIEEDDGYLYSAQSVVVGTITLKPGLPAGPFQETFQVKTNYPGQSNVQFRASGQIVGGSLSISGRGYEERRGIDLGSTVAGRGISREFVIQFFGTSAPSSTIQVQAVEPSWLRASLSPPRDAGARRFFSLTIEVPEDAPTGSYVFDGDGRRASITLETNDPAMPVVRIPLQFAVVR